MENRSHLTLHPACGLPDFLRDRINAFFASASICHAVKPRFALIVPDEFDPHDAAHRAELAVALTLAAQLVPGYAFDVCTDAELGPLLTGARPLGALSGGGGAGDAVPYVFALVLLDRALAKALSARLPVRLLGTDAAAPFRQKLRLTFWDPRAEEEDDAAAVDPASLRDTDVLLFVDPFTRPAQGIQHLLRLRAAGVSPRVVLLPSCGARALSAWRAEVPEPGRLHVFTEPVAAGAPLPFPPAAVVCATDRFALAFFPGARRLHLRTDGTLHAPGPQPPAPARHILYKGEDLDALGLLSRILGTGAPAGGDGPAVRCTRPLVSIVVPVYDRTTEIERLARSIFTQAYPHLEVVLVSNGSPPATLEVLRSIKALLIQRRIRVRHLRFDTAYGCATVPRDIGAFASRGEFLCFIDSDDYFEPGFFDAFLEKPLDEDAIYYPRKIFRDHGRDMGRDFPLEQRLPGYGDIGADLYEVLCARGNLFSNSGTMVSRRSFLRAHGIWHELRYAEDYYLWLRIAKSGARAIEHAGVVSITLHPGNNELAVKDARAVERAKAQAAVGIL